MRPRSLLILAAVLVMCAGSLFEVAHARVNDTVKFPARIHFSSNFEGELEPCG